MKIIKDFVLREIAGECMLVPVGATTKEFNGMISVSSSAKYIYIWENIEKVDSLDELIALVFNEFEVEEEMAKADTTEFISQLLEQGFVAYTQEEEGW